MDICANCHLSFDQHVRLSAGVLICPDACYRMHEAVEVVRVPDRAPYVSVDPRLLAPVTGRPC